MESTYGSPQGHRYIQPINRFINQYSNQKMKTGSNKNLLRIYVLAMLGIVSFSQETTQNVVGENYKIVSSLETELPFDENGHLATYQLVFPSDDIAKNCPALHMEHTAVELAALTGEALEQVFPDYQPDTATISTDECQVACLERGVERSLAAYPMPHKRFTGNKNNEKAFDDWFTEQCSAVEVCFMNYYDKDYDLHVYWVPPPDLQQSGQASLILNGKLKYGEENTRCIFSHLGHEFQIVNTRDNTIVQNITIEFPLSIAFGTNPRHQELIVPNQFDNQIKSSLRSEWDKHLIPKRTFSTLGFSHGKLPKDVFGAMGTFYYNNRNFKVREDWLGKGVFVNWYETDVFMIQIPWIMKSIWQKELADLVSQWTGVPCEQTVMYGLRQYETNARLLTHVDRLNTHVVSLIVNVAQGGLDEDWPVEVFDHYGRLHEVVMEPGDIVYYESAKNLHSRNRPLTGKNAYYTNLFTHYRPIGAGDNWYKSDTEPGREPILEVEGTCVVPPEVVSKETEYKGYGRVKCDDPRLGSNISPSLFVANSAQDLIDWWERTTPDNWSEIVRVTNERSASMYSQEVRNVREQPVVAPAPLDDDFDDHLDYYDGMDDDDDYDPERGEL